MTESNMLVRADASTRIGTGHVMRCLALAQAWYGHQGQAIFLMAMEGRVVEGRLRSEGMEVSYVSAQPGSIDDAIQTVEIARTFKVNWIIIDGYHFGGEYQRFIKDQGYYLLLIDDNGDADHYYADLILNQNNHAHEELYKNREPYTSLLLGNEYVLLRREFLKWRGWERDIPEVARKILVTLGGADPGNVTLRVIETLQNIDIPDIEAKIVVGPFNPNLSNLQSAVTHQPSGISILQDVSDMSELVAWADIAVVAGGTTCWELAFMGLPCLIIVLAQNQEAIAQKMDDEGAAVNYGWYYDFLQDRFLQRFQNLMNSKSSRLKMAHRGKQIVCGSGAERILDQMAAVG